MPTYAYACSGCEHAFDIRQSFSDLPLTTCPRCEQETLRKLFSPVGVVFKGSGFYRNDSRAAAHSTGGGRDKGGDQPGEKSATGAAKDVGAGSAGSGSSSGSGSGDSGSGGSGDLGSGGSGDSGSGGSGSGKPAAGTVSQGTRPASGAAAAGA